MVILIAAVTVHPKRRLHGLLLVALVALLTLTAGAIAGFGAWRRAKEEAAMKARDLVRDLDHWQTAYDIAIERSDRETLEQLVEQARALKARRLELQDEGLAKAAALDADFVEWHAESEIARKNEDQKALERLLDQGVQLEARWKALQAERLSR